MSEYGIGSKLINAASIEECNQGVRNYFDEKECMIVNSLFLDWLLENGMRVHNGNTLDIVTLAFDYGTRSYEEERKHMDKLLAETDPEDTKRLESLTTISAGIDQNKDKYHKISKTDLRRKYYTDGVSITWKFFNKNGTVRETEVIHYKMLYRTPGRAKAGKCVFICDRMYDKASNFLRMGITLPEDNAPIVEIGAYSSLITSSIVGRVHIEPEDVLILKDYSASFKTNVISIEINDSRECIAVHRDGYELSTDMFDGSALIDTSVFPEWGDGFILLRHHMTKCAAFHTYIQRFFKHYCKEHGINYDKFTVKDMWGNEHLAKNIKLITTNNSAKWLKFGITYEQWSEQVRANGSLFGIVKTSHESKLGTVQQMSYQMVNALSIDSMDSVLSPTIDYVTQLQNDDETLLEYLDRNKNFSNDYEVLIALVNHNPDFARSEYFRDRKKYILGGYVRNLKTGKLIQNADNLTLIGNPYGMLMYAVGVDPRGDPTFEHEEGTIQCFTNRFDDGEYLAEFRNPFNSRENLGYLHNHYHEYFDKYFHFGKQIIAVNVNGTDFCDRNNGSDFDSDSIYVTNQPDIVAHAKYCYKNHPTIVNNIPKASKTYTNSLESFAVVDNDLAKAQNAIGESSNLAQICLTYSYNFPDQKYKDYVCILAVLA